MPTLRIVMPVYNEGETVRACLERVIAAELPPGWSRSIEMVDDCSQAANRDAVRGIVDDLQRSGCAITLHEHAVNRGKGAALQTAFDAILARDDVSADDLVTIQDADLEYDPADFAALMAPLLEREADVVLGTRWGAHARLRGLKRRIHAIGNGALTMLSNLMTGFRVSDMECCYKMMSIGVLRSIRPMLSEPRFGIEPQMVAAFARRRLRVTEVPVRYEPRWSDAGKKIGWRDGVRAIWVIGRERFRG